LHGSGGSNNELIPLAQELAPGSSAFGHRCIDGDIDYFNRFPDRTMAEAAITSRMPVPADFIEATMASHSLAMPAIIIGQSTAQSSWRPCP
jgi:predicted esterase